MKKVKRTRKIDNLKLKKILAALGLMFVMGTVASNTVHAEEEVLFEDTSSDDVNLEDAKEPEVQDTLPAGQETQPAQEESQPVVEQENHEEKETPQEEKVNDGSVDTSAGTNPADAEKDPYNGNNNDYFDDYDKEKDPDPKGGEYIDSDDEETRKGLKDTPDNPTPDNPTPDNPTPDNPTPENPTPENPQPAPVQPTPAPVEPKPMPKTADERSPLAPIAGGTAVIGISALLHLLIKERNKLKMIQSQLEKTEEVEEHISLGR